MIPIEKNISVVDEQGNEYEATYSKRAKGLVKNGRARFVSENRICLACPPDELMEDEKMSDITNNTETIETTEKTCKDIYKDIYNIQYVIEQIERISNTTAYLDSVISELRQTETPDGVGDIAAQSKAQALADVVRCRETTNQQMLKLYEKMYDDLKPKDYTEKMLAVFENAVSGVTNCSDDSAEVISSAIDSIRQIFRENFSKK